MKRKSTITTFLLAVFFAFSGVSAQNTGSIAGEIKNKATQSPVEGATVQIMGTSLGSYTNSKGQYRIDNIPPGVYTVQFSSIGFEKYSQANVTVIAGKSRTLEIELAEKDIILEGAEVRGSYFINKSETVTSYQTLGAEDIRRAPGVQEDVVRAAALLPGVNVTAAGRNDLIVRGGAPFENLFIVDNIEVPNINHFGSQGSTGGPLSLINLDYVKNLEFSAGGFGAKFGDKVSSLTKITLENGGKEEYGGKVNLSATGFSANIDGPISNRGNFILSARRSYLDFIFNAAGFGFIPEYWDFLAKFHYHLNDQNNLTFLGIGALDNVKLNNDNRDNRYSNSRFAAPSQNQYFSGLTWQRLFDNGFMNMTLGRSYSEFETFQNDSLLNRVFNNISQEGETQLKTDFEFTFSPKSDLQFGAIAKYASLLDYDVFVKGFLRLDDKGVPQEFKSDTSFSALKAAAYASYSQSIGSHKFTAGGRIDYFNFLQEKIFASPRLAYTFQVNEVSALIASAGRYYQSPSYIWLLSNQNSALEPITVDKAVLGYEHNPFEDLKVQVEVYYKAYSNYPARKWRPQAVLSPSGFDDFSTDIPFGLEPLISSAKGYSRGIELFIQKKLSDVPLYGLLSLTLSQSKFTSLDGIERNSAFDSRFIGNISLGYRFNAEWEVSGKFRIATGIPTTPFAEDGRIQFEYYNEGERLPLFHALDLRVDKRWNASWFTIVTYLDVQNVYGRKNVSGVKWDYRLNQKEFQSSLGIFPTIGVSFEF